MYRFFVPLLFAALASAQLTAPRVGFVRYPDAKVRVVYGLPASFTVGDVTASGVQAASFSDAGGILSADTRLYIVSASGVVLADKTGADNAIVGIEDSLATAAAYLPDSNTLVHFDRQHFETISLAAPLPGRVLSLRAERHTASLLIENEGAVSEVNVSLASGNLLSENFLPGVAGPAAYLHDSIVYVDRDGLEIRTAGGSIRTLPGLASTQISFERMSGSWLHITCAATGQQWALNVSAKRLQLSELPMPVAGVRP